ncbi:MAG: glutamate-cysteine ligase family protein, partial [Pirellulales bacterium]|nr:glutamate-cysteine ligase family protein [Pirellulales bacterium]
MATIDFTSNPRPTLGIEVELGLVDSNTMALSSSYADLENWLSEEDKALVKPELMQCVVEINTGVCETINEAEQDLQGNIGKLEKAADQAELRLWWGATHPFSPWREQKVTPNDRYHKLVELLQ